MQKNDHYLVTGAGRDLGRSVAINLAAEGRTILLHTHDHQHLAHETKAAVEARGARAVVLRADFSRPAEVEAFISATREALGTHQLSGLVLNAAVAAATPLEGGKESNDALRQMLEVNLLAPDRLMLGLADKLADHSSVVYLSVCSTTKVFSPAFGGFSASKAAADCLVVNWAVALGARGIRVNSIAPGVMDANFRSQLLQDQGFRNSLIEATALKRVATIQDVADAVTLLLTPEARWITGQTIETSGGWKL